MPRFSIVRCDHCKAEHKVGEEDSSPLVFQILHLVDSTGNDWYYCTKKCLQEWLEKYESPYAEKEKAPITAFLPEEIN